MTEGLDWQRLADAITTRRRQLRVTQAQMNAAGGPSMKTIGLLESKSLQAIKSQTKRGLEMALDWAPGSVDRILAGGDPTIASTDSAQPRTEVLDERPGERLIVDIVAGVGNLSDERRREILTLIRAMQQSDSPD